MEAEEPPQEPSDLEQRLAGMSREELLALIRKQAADNKALQKEIGELKECVAELKERLDDSDRRSLRQAAPFERAKKKPPEKKKKAGRKKGHGGSHRMAPPEPDEYHEQALPSTCPHCQYALDGAAAKAHVQTIQDLQVRCVNRRVTTYSCTCSHCHQRVHTRHPLQTSQATGAAGCHLGENAIATAVALNKQFGLSTRKTCSILQNMFGLRLSPGGLTHLCHRAATWLKSHYHALFQQARQSPALHVDETSWYVGESGHFLHVATTPELTLYRVLDHRRRESVEDLLGDLQQYTNVLVSDCLNIYDLDIPYQQKCYAHHLKAISSAIAAHPRGGTSFLAACKALLQHAMEVGRTRHQLTPAELHQRRQDLQQQAVNLLHITRADALETQVRNRLFRQIDHLFTFLDHPDVDPTNNLAERQLRPAVISRKISCGNKTRAGADTWQILASLAATAHQRGESFLHILSEAARAP